MNSINVSRVLAMSLLMTMFATSGAFFWVQRYCLVSLRLRTSTTTVMRDVPDFTVGAFWGYCPTLQSQCSNRVLSYVQSIYGSQTNPITGSTAQNLCTLFGQTLRPADSPVVEIKYITDKCSSEQYLNLGSLCCYQCTVAGSTTYVPVPNCVAPTTLPTGCTL